MSIIVTKTDALIEILEKQLDYYIKVVLQDAPTPQAIETYKQLRLNYWELTRLLMPDVEEFID